MSKGRGRQAVAMPTGGRTKRGKEASQLGEEHYLRRVRNLVDGLNQESRKHLFRSLGVEEPESVTTDEVIRRLNKGDESFSDLLKQAGKEKLPGCGTLFLASTVGTKPESLHEENALALLKKLNAENYTYTARTGHNRDGTQRTGIRNYWPGFVRLLLTFSPGDMHGIAAALTAGVLTPQQFRELLLTLIGQVSQDVAKATKLPGAKSGIKIVMAACHMAQGCLHLHLYGSDVNTEDPTRSRLGLFLKTEKSVRPRLTLNGLGISELATRRHRTAGHLPPVAVFKSLGLCENWRVLETAELHRKAKGLGPCWDVLLSDSIDAFWKRELSGPLGPYYEKGHEQWATEYQQERRKKLGWVEKVARELLAPEFTTAEKAKAEAVKSKADADRRGLEAELTGVRACVRMLKNGLELSPLDAKRSGFQRNERTRKWVKSSWSNLERGIGTPEFLSEVAAVKADYLSYSADSWRSPNEVIAEKIRSDAAAMDEMPRLMSAVSHIQRVQKGEIEPRPEIFGGFLKAANCVGGLILTESFGSAFSRHASKLRAVLGDASFESFESDANRAALIASYNDGDFDSAQNVLGKIYRRETLSAADRLYIEDESSPPRLRDEIWTAAAITKRQNETGDKVSERTAGAAADLLALRVHFETPATGKGVVIAPAGTAARKAR